MLTINRDCIDWVKLTRFASSVTYDATGKACIVRAGCDSDTWGRQGFDGRFWEIELNVEQPRDRVMETFLHELGHACNQHVTKTIAAGGLGRRSVEYLEDADFRDKVKARLYTIESEADAFAASAGAVFRRELGDAWLDWPFVG